MTTRQLLTRSQFQQDHSIPMEEFDLPATQDRKYTQNPAIKRQASLPTTELRRRKSHMEQWEADLVDQLPSRQGAGSTGTLRLNRTIRGRKKSVKQGFGTIRGPHGLEGLETEEIVENLMSDPDFADGPTELQTEDIKGLHTNLARKLSIQAKLRENEERENKHITWSKQVRYSISLLWKRTRVNIAEVSYSVDLWRGHLKKIEGKFGSGVASYFQFMKWLVQLNIPVFILLFGFITIPQLLQRTNQSPAYNHSVSFKGIEILTGEGWFKESELYYGTHYNGSITWISGFFYSMPHAYLLTIAGYYTITVIALLYSLTKSYKKNFIDGSDMNQFQSVTKVLCGWDFAITAPQAAFLKHQSVHKELQEYLSVFRTSDVERTRLQTCRVVILRIFINLLCLGFITGSGYLIRYVSEEMQVERDKFHGLEQLALPLVISAVIFVLPLVFSALVDLENYENPQVPLYLVMARTIVLFIVSLGVLIQYWFSNVQCPSKTSSNAIATSKTPNQETCSQMQCWENSLGYNMYRLVVVDFLVTLLITFFTEFVRRLMAQYCIKALGFPEFDIGRNTLYLIYSQSLIWIAVFYSPLLPFIVILKLILLFYVKRYSIMNNCKPSVKPWRGGRAHTIIMTMLGLALILCFIAVGYSIVRLTPSVACGPYMGKDTAYIVIQDFFEMWAKREKTFSTIIQFVTSAGFLAGIILGLLIAAYYTRIRAHGLDESVVALKEQIALEGKDKKFLIKLIQSAGPQAAAKGPRTKPQNYSNLALSPDERVNDDEGEEDSHLLENHSSDEEYGGKQFAKPTIEAAYGNLGGDYNGAPGAPRGPAGRNSGVSTPRSSGGSVPRDSGISEGAPGGPTRTVIVHTLHSLEPPAHDAHNEGFVDKSWDLYHDDDDDGLVVGEPGLNAAYTDRPLTNRPKLPHPGLHYDVIRGGSRL